MCLSCCFRASLFKKIGARLLPSIACLKHISPLSFMPLVPYPARFARHLPLEGKALSVVILFPHMRVFALAMREKRCSRIVAFPIGEGGPRQRRSGALVNDALETIFPLFFIPLPPSNLRPFGAPPSIGRRECPREPLPLEGAAERSEAGLASSGGGEAPSSLPSPLGKAGHAAALGCSRKRRT